MRVLPACARVRRERVAAFEQRSIAGNPRSEALR